MQFGVWYDLRQNLEGAKPYSRFYQECVEEIVTAEGLGFDQVWFSEHHFVDDGYLPSQLIAASHVAGRTQKIQVGTNVLLLPLYHPLRVAEDAAVLDLMSNGRLILGVGAGYVDFEFETLGVERKHRPSLLEEGVAILRQVWDTGRTGFQGKRWQFPDLPFAPQPERRLPIWFGANAEAAVRRAGRLADGFMTGGPQAIAQAPELYRHWAEAAREAGRNPEDLPFMLSGWLYLDEDAERAWRTVAPLIAYQLNRYAEWGTDRDKPRPAQLSAADLKHADFPLIGAPSSVAATLKEVSQKVPLSHFCFWARLPGLTHEQALASTELFAKQVIPRLT